MKRLKFTAALGLILVFASAGAHSKTITCGRSGQGKFRIDLSGNGIHHVQSRLLGGEKITPVVINSFRKLNCDECVQVTGEFDAGDRVVVGIATRQVGSSTVADINIGVSDGSEGADSGVPCK